MTKSCTRRDPDGTPGSLDDPAHAGGPAPTVPDLGFHLCCRILPRWGSRVRIPSSAPEKPQVRVGGSRPSCMCGVAKLPGVPSGSRLVHDFVIEPRTHSEGHCPSLEDLAAASLELTD